MPKITFVNEHRVVEVERGRLISEVAKDLGIVFRRETFAGTRIGDSTVWVKRPADCVSPPGFWERLKGARGWKRFADSTHLLGDCEVYTQPGLADRLGGTRTLASAPRPLDDRSLLRAPDAAPTAAYPFGHPSAVGKGERTTPARGAEHAKSKKGAAASEDTEAEASETEAPAVAAAETPAAEAPAVGAAKAAPGGKAMDPDKAARLAEKKARQAALKAKLAAAQAEAKSEDGASAETPKDDTAHAGSTEAKKDDTTEGA